MTGNGAEVTDVGARAYRVPTETPEADGTLSWSDTTVVVVFVHTAGHTGLGWTYAHHAIVDLVKSVLRSAVLGIGVTDVPAAREAMQRAIRNHGRPGLISCAMSAVEVAQWDAAARLHELPLSRLLGRAHESVPVYGSGGFTTYDDDQLRTQLHRYAGEHGMSAVKIKIGESWGTSTERDLRRVRFAQELTGTNTALFVDANGAYSIGQAVRMGELLDQLDVRWYEEPVSSDDRTGLRRVREAVGADVAAGEYGYHPSYFAGMLDAEAVDCPQIDLTRCGGIGEWQRIAALAAARNLDVSGHCAQNLTAHVAVCTPNVRHLEWFRDHERVEETLFDGTLRPHGGAVRPDMSVPGHGMALKEPDSEPYRVR
ncbi:L-alanine-DL-glutamate epimerase [Actinopolyspora alba]|uniref:L-alanine-DL-glutamate epimerase n=1 Tax=Actinopolyspora alba TaxID=673379 RepID=A0A1I2ACW8_9ACTN|nr:L-alanine-DL-glutamate epimerase [Actinopolyspora alba]